MRRLLRNLLAALLAMLARGVIRKYDPIIVMVTGSVGKTSTKDAITAVLSQTYYLRASKKNFNSEFGVPLTVFGMADRWSGIADWVPVIGEALALLILPNHYPKMLILEVGADSPGDLARILKIATPDLVVVTRLPDMPVHVEAYATPAAVREEEFAPAYALAPGSTLIVSADDAHARTLAAPLSVELWTYGFSEDADIRLTDEKAYGDAGRPLGMEAVVSDGETSARIVLAGALGRPQLLAPAAAVAVAKALGQTLEQAAKTLADYQPPPGRGRLLAGRNGSLILDDTYNASPAAVSEALISLTSAHGARSGRRIAALADMLELGRYSQGEHESIGRQAAQSTDALIAVGVRSRAMAEAAREAGMSESSIHTFDTAIEAADWIRDAVREGDTVLIKGSQSMRMEYVSEALLEDASDAKHLVRQGKEWKKA